MTGGPHLCSGQSLTLTGTRHGSIVIGLGCSLGGSVCQNGKEWEEKSGSVHVDQLLKIES